MVFATLLIPGQNWLLPAAILLGLAALLLFWSYRKGAASGAIRCLCLLLKFIGTVALAACLLDPLWSGQRARPGANFFVIVADNSQGMQIKDRGETRTRADFLRDLLISSKGGWPEKLDENFQVRRYFFDARLQPARDYSELTFDGRASAIGGSLHAIAERYRGQPLAGVLLLTDGNATDIGDGKPDLTGLPPVYPVVIGRDEPIKDIALRKLTVQQTAFEDAPVTVQAEVSAAGYAGRTVVAQLLDLDGKKVAEQKQRAPGDSETTNFRLQTRPEKSGVVFYRIRVSAADEQDQFSAPAVSQEATLANNSRAMVADRGGGPYRILYVAGRPNWEFKFMNRALAEDDQVQVVGLIRVARREPKFDFRGRPGESSNPLFRGFDNQSKEDVERYDQPVIVRLNTRDAAELAGGFPKAAEELFAYHAIVVDDLEADFFTRDQMALIQRFVSERGGGFLMLGGAETFQQGKYLRTPVGDMLPVYLDSITESGNATNFHLALTPEGWLQPWARLRNNEADERSRLDAMPPFQIMNHVRDIKPGASVIATVKDDSGKSYPALVIQRFGNGRVGALTLGDFWRWGLRDEAMHRDFDKAWRQLMRWLVSDVPNRVELRAEALPGSAGETMVLQVRVRDKQFQPLDNASVSLTVRAIPDSLQSPVGTNETRISAGTNVIHLTAEPALTEAGLYQATYVSRETGAYLAEASVRDAAGIDVGSAQAGWTADPAADEFRSLKPNRALLESIARDTGGEVIDPTKLDQFVAGLPNRKAPITETWSNPLWHRPAVLAFALACFAAEWGLRRRKGMA